MTKPDNMHCVVDFQTIGEQVQRDETSHTGALGTQCKCNSTLTSQSFCMTWRRLTDSGLLGICGDAPGDPTKTSSLPVLTSLHVLTTRALLALSLLATDAVARRSSSDSAHSARSFTISKRLLKICREKKIVL